MFFAREREIKEIKGALDSPNFEGIILIGRRRVGKSEIIKQATGGYSKSVLNFECKKTLLQDNLRDFAREVTDFFSLPRGTKFESFDAIFDYVLAQSVEKEFLLVIDEFSYLLDTSGNAVDSSLAKAINRYKTSSKLKLIIAGSYVHLMQKIIEQNQPLYGRFTHIISVEPFDYYDSALFYPNYSAEDKILMYSVFGGMPYFNSLIDTKKSATENIMELIVRKDSILEHEINEIILSETKKIDILNSLITLIASGCTKYTDIVNSLSSSKHARPDYILSKLCDMKILKKVTPINEKENKKRTFYAFCDNLMHFYYSFIFKNSSKRAFMDVNDFFDMFVKDYFYTNYLPHKFEEISSEFLIRKNKKKQIEPIFYNIGTYSVNDKKAGYREFDIVTEDVKGYTVYECKYASKPISTSIINEEMSQVDTSSLGAYRLGFISRSGYEKSVDIASNLYFSLDEFYQSELAGI